MKQQLRALLQKYNHAVLLIYILIYFVWFFALEQYAKPVVWVRSWLDAYIPFQELFIIPYTLWFLYVAVSIGYFFFTSREQYYRLCGFLFTGMTICLLIYTFFPNGHHLRPLIFPRENLFTDMVRNLYLADTPTNVCPSIHCLNSLGVHIALRRSSLGKNRVLRYASGTLMISICMATVFLKQHSIIDVFWAFVLCIPLYIVCYRVDWARVAESRARRKMLSAPNVK